MRDVGRTREEFVDLKILRVEESGIVLLVLPAFFSFCKIFSPCPIEGGPGVPGPPGFLPYIRRWMRCGWLCPATFSFRLRDTNTDTSSVSLRPGTRDVATRVSGRK